MSSARTRIVIFSGSFGGGCTAAAGALSGYLDARHGDAVDVVVCDFLEEFLPSLGVLAKFAYQQSEEFFPVHTGEYAELLDAAIDNPVVADLRKSDLSGLATYLDSHEPAAVIATFPLAGALVARAAGARDIVCATTVLDYDPRGDWFDPSRVTYFVSCREARERLSVRGVPWEHVIEAGIPVRSEFAERPVTTSARLEHGLDDRFTVLLVATTGAPGDVADLASRIASTWA
jgi:UDP-N-acetylglucosamine:LPS N-acetylglucosamine transferase